MPFAGEWCKVWIYFGFVFAWTKGARPRFDTSTDMGLVLVPADAEVDSVIFRLRATDQDADFPLVFEITATITPVVRIDNLPCTLYNKVCQANVILTKRLVPGRLHDFAVRVRDTKGDSNSMQATISVTNATTPRDKIFPHIPSLIMVPEDTKPGKELDYLLVRANSWSGKPVYIELWQPKELFTIRQRQTPTQTRGVITLIGELDFETQSMYTLTMYATDPYTESGKDTRNIAGLSVVVIVQDVQDVPPIFTLAPPLTRINNSVQPGDTIVRVHAEDGDKGVPREIVYGLVSEGNPFTPFFNISETSGEITLARPLEELTQITHVGAPVVLTVVAEEIRRSREEPPAQATVVDVGFLLGEPGNSPPYFESDNYAATIDENLEPGTVINFGEQYSTRVKDEDIGKAGVFALKLENNNGTFEINPTVAERTADFVITVRDNTLIDYELQKVLSFKIVAQEVGPATNLSASVPVTIFLKDVNDNPPVFEEESYEVTLSENVTEGSRVIQVHATDKDTGAYSSIRYTNITGDGSEAFSMDHLTGLITVAMGTSLDREIAARLVLSIEARDENGSGNKGVVPLIVNLLDVNDNVPIFEKDTYEFMLNADLTNFTSPVFIKAIDADAEPPNNVVRYELIHGNYENKFYLNETSGELILRSPITKIRRKKQSVYDKSSSSTGDEFVKSHDKILDDKFQVTKRADKNETFTSAQNNINSMNSTREIRTEVIKRRRRRAEDALYTLTARAYDLGVPHLSSVTKIRILSGVAMEARIMMFVVPGEQPDSIKTAETLAAITGGRVTVLETRNYNPQNQTGSAGAFPGGGKKSIIVARVEQTEPGTPLVDVEKIREALAANGVGIIGGTVAIMNTTTHVNSTKDSVNGTPRSNVNDGQSNVINNTFTSIHSEEVTVYKAENKLLFWLLIILGLLMLLAIAALIICCICPGCPFYMAPRKRRVHSSETLLVRADGRPKRHLHRQPAVPIEVSWNGRKQAWSADPTRRNWQFNKRNVKNCSLPGDVAYISGQPNDVHAPLNVDAQRLRDGLSYGHSRRSRMNAQERMYMEDVEGQNNRGYDTAEMDSLQQHEMERGSDLQRQAYRQRSDPRYMEPNMHVGTTVREQHFYREGNAEVLRLVTRGQMEDTPPSHIRHPHHHRPTTLIVDGKDIILQRFIEDQNSRHDLTMQDIDAPRSMESHQRSKEVFQQQQPEIILVPERLELGHRQHIEEIGPKVQRLVIDHGDYELQKMERESQMRESLRQDQQETVAAATSVPERIPIVTKEHVQTNNTQYSFHDLELARQNALLTKLLLERENRRAGGAGGVDSTSYLETQSLPGQVAIATQTDRTASTQTERHVRSRSDNDESDEESRRRKKLKSRKKYGDGDWKKSRTLWMKSPIEEEGSPRFDKRLSILRKKVKEVKEGRKISLEPEVLREISDSLDGNGSSCKGEDDETRRRYRKSTEQTSISYKILNEKENGSLSSEEIDKERKGKVQKDSEDVTDDQKTNATESTSSPDIKIEREKRDREKIVEKSPKKDAKLKTQKKSAGVIKPSFKILEKEFTMLTKKLSKLGDKKFHESTGSDSTSQERSESLSKESKKDLDQKSSKRVDATSGQKQGTENGASVSKSEQKGKQKKDSIIAKTKQKLKYQQAQVMSTGSSEFEDSLDKSKKSGAARQETVKPKQSVGSQSHLKVKRAAQVDRREFKKQMSEFRDEDIEKRKDGPVKETAKAELKPEKVEKGKVMTRAAKLAAMPRRNVTEESSTSTEEKKDGKGVPTLGDFEKNSSVDRSEIDSSGFQHRHEEEIVAKKVNQRFSDDFVEESKTESTEGKTMTSTEEEEGLKKKIVTEEKLGTAAKVPLTTGGLEKLKRSGEKSEKESIEERLNMKKLSHDSLPRLDSDRNLIKTTSKEGKFTESREVVPDQAIGKVTLAEAEFTKAEESKQHRATDVQANNMETMKQNDKKEISENRQKDYGDDELDKDMVQPVQKNSQDYLKQDDSKPEGELQEKKPQAGELNDLQEGERIQRSIEKGDGPIEEIKTTPIQQKTEQICTKEKEENTPNEIRIHENIKRDIENKGDVKQEAAHGQESEILSGEANNGEIGSVRKIKEPVEEYVNIEMQTAKNDIIQSPVDELNAYRTEDKIYQTDKEEENRTQRVDVPHADNFTEEKKEDTINDYEKRTSRVDNMEVHYEGESISESKTDDRKSEGKVLLDDEKRYDKLQDESIKSKTDDQSAEITVLDKDEKISDKEKTAVERKAEDRKVNKEAIEGHEIVKELTVSHEVVGESTKGDQTLEEPTEEHRTVGEPTEDHKIIVEQAEAYEINEKSTEEFNVVGEPIKNNKTVEEQTEICKIDEGPIVNHKMVEEPTDGHAIVEKQAEVYNIDERQTEDQQVVEKPSESHKMVEDSTEDYNIVTEAPEDHKIVIGATDDKPMAEEVEEDPKITQKNLADCNVSEKVPVDHRHATETSISNSEVRIYEEEKRASIDVSDDKMSAEKTIILNEAKGSYKEGADITEDKIVDQKPSEDKKTSSDKEEETVSIKTDDENKTKDASFDKVEYSAKEETTIDQTASDQYKIAENEHISFDKESKVLPEKNIQGSIGSNSVDENPINVQDDSIESEEKKITLETQKVDKDQMNEKENMTKGQESNEYKISEKKVLTKTRAFDDDHMSEKHTTLETSKIDEQKRDAEKEQSVLTQQDHYSYKENFPSDTSDKLVNKDVVTEEQNHSSQMPTTAEQESEKTNVTPEIPISTSDNIDKEITKTATNDGISEKVGVLAGVVTAVHSLVNKLTNGTEVGISDHPPADDEIAEKELPASSSTDKGNKQMKLECPSVSSSLEVADESIKPIAQQTETRKTTEDSNKDKITSLTDDKITSHPQDEQNLPLNVAVDRKTKKDSTVDNETSKLTSETTVPEKSIETQETNKSLTEETVSSIKVVHENSKDPESVMTEISETTFDVRAKSEKVPENETVDGNLIQISENEEQLHEPPSKESSSFQGTELPETSSQTTETTEIKKSALDSIISETPTDSAKISGSEKQLVPVSEQTDLQKVEQFVGEETFAPEGNKIRPLPAGQPRKESDASLTVSQEEYGEQDLTEEKIDEAVPLKEDVPRENRKEEPVEEQYADVSLPPFSSVDTVDDSYDSDSSSDVSRKTTLTTRPYQTPRHHAREFPENEGIRAMESSDVHNIDNLEGETLTIELSDDKTAGSSTESNIFGNIGDTLIEQALATKVIGRVDDKETVLGVTDSMNTESPFTDEKVVTVPDIENTKHGKLVESKYTSKVDEKSSTARTRLQDKKLGSEVKHQERTTGKNAASSVSKVAKTETFKVIDKRFKETEKKRVPPQRKKKSTSEESSEEKATHSQNTASHARHRTRKKTIELKQQDSQQEKQLRRMDEVSRRKESVPKSRGDKEKKSSSGREKHQTSPNTGEIDTSKAQPKYMAWYKKNREEMEKKRAELMATDDEEQLPRWLRRSMRNQKSEREDKNVSDRKTADTTPRMRRKVKPLVNVESEQLKAIVRQGRKLRRAEGGKNEDPPVQIFATTPPAVSQTDPNHHLVQHSEYKYEKMPVPFYLHPPPAPHPSPQLSPEHFDIQSTVERGRVDEDFDSTVAVSLQGGNRLRHQQLLEKKSVFDIAYSEAAPSQLRSDSTTPPS